ncbi:hypothetical protein DPV78_011826 [Talaromyces pinophilus]|nr:hypothetical protein DPV78_011826 [Talaromyces pinophilus]
MSSQFHSFLGGVGDNSPEMGTNGHCNCVANIATLDGLVSSHRNVLSGALNLPVAGKYKSRCHLSQNMLFGSILMGAKEE